MGQYVLLWYYIQMIFKQLFDTKSSTYTYLISSGKGREALVIDPVIENVSEYIGLLKELDLKLVKVIDTHIHADHVTGASELKDITKFTTIMVAHTPAESVEIKVKDEEYINLENPNKSIEGEVMDELGLHRYCCRRMILGNVHLITNI